jgi:hypothetical protein
MRLKFIFPPVYRYPGGAIVLAGWPILYWIASDPATTVCQSVINKRKSRGQALRVLFRSGAVRVDARERMPTGFENRIRKMAGHHKFQFFVFCLIVSGAF